MKWRDRFLQPTTCFFLATAFAIKHCPQFKTLLDASRQFAIQHDALLPFYRKLLPNHCLLTTSYSNESKATIATKL